MEKMNENNCGIVIMKNILIAIGENGKEVETKKRIVVWCGELIEN